MTNNVITSGIRVVRNYTDGGSLWSIRLTHGVGIGLGILAISTKYISWLHSIAVHFPPIRNVCLWEWEECCVSLHQQSACYFHSDIITVAIRMWAFLRQMTARLLRHSWSMMQPKQHARSYANRKFYNFCGGIVAEVLSRVLCKSFRIVRAGLYYFCEAFFRSTVSSRFNRRKWLIVAHCNAANFFIASLSSYTTIQDTS